MAQFRGFSIPSLQATVNVAWETIKAKWPENSPCMELIRGPAPGEGQQRPGSFKTFEGGEHTEMTTMNGQDGECRDQNSVAVAEDSFSYQRSG